MVVTLLGDLPDVNREGNDMFTKRIMDCRWSCLLLLALTITICACNSGATPTTEIVVQSPLPTPTLEPTFTPSPSPTNIPTASPTATTEPTPTPLPQANLSGQILDQETGQPIDRAKVSAGAETATTDTDGHYSLTSLAPGQYVLSATHDGYDPALSAIFTLSAGQELEIDLTLYAPDTSPYPQDPMLTNPLDPNGAPTKEDAERLAREQGLTGKVVSIKETKLRGKYLVNYKRNDNVRAAVAELNHDAWELTDETERKWWIIKVCGNLASLLPQEAPIATPAPRPLPPLAEVVVDRLVVRTCAAEECAEVGTVSHGTQVEVFGCLAKGGDWCEVGWSGGRGWCTGQSLRQLAVAEAVPRVEAVLPTVTPGVVVGEGKIVFGSWGEGGDQNGIYVINPDGTGLTALTMSSSPGALDSSPAWSPDRERIVFHRDADIYVMNADGNGQTPLTNSPGTFDDYPTWSPDSQRIAFVSNRNSLYVMNADGSGLTRLTDSGSRPSWSPDGTRIAFDGIYVINTDGSNLIRLTDRGYAPDWSPDGTRIAFVLDGIIYVMNADGSNQTRLTDSGFQSPAWSPDGQQIVFSSSGADAETLYIIKADGSGLRRLIEGFEPDW